MVDLDDDEADVYLDGQWVATAQYDDNGPVTIKVITFSNPPINADVTTRNAVLGHFSIRR